MNIQMMPDVSRKNTNVMSCSHCTEMSTSRLYVTINHNARIGSVFAVINMAGLLTEMGLTVLSSDLV